LFSLYSICPQQLEKKDRPSPVFKGKGKGKGTRKGKGNFRHSSVSLNNVNTLVRRHRPPPVRRGTQNNVSSKIAFNIAQRKANQDAMQELRTMVSKSLTLKERKNLDKKKREHP